MPRNAIFGIGAGVVLLYGVLQMTAIRQLTGKRRVTGLKYLTVGAAAVITFVLDLARNSIGSAAIEFYLLVAGTPLAIVHLGILLTQERRRKRLNLLRADG